MKFLGQAQNFVKRFVPCGARDVGFGRTNQDVFRRMGKVNKLEQLCFVTTGLEQVGTDGVCHGGGNPLLNNAIAGKDGKVLALDLMVELMLAAGNGENHGGIP